MLKLNSERKSCKDVFNAFLVEEAEYAGEIELPIIKGTTEIPQDVISFSKSMAGSNSSAWVHFYEHDYVIERIWNNPLKYLDVMKKYRGVILPDFSLYRDMPLVMQQYNIYRSRAIGQWLQSNGIEVITNIRFGDERTYKTCCIGVPHNSTICIGTHGSMKNIIDRKILEEGIKVVINELTPKNIVFYGTVTPSILELCKDRHIRVQIFASEYSITHKKKER